MSIHILTYSLTDTTRQLARRLATRLDGAPYEISAPAFHLRGKLGVALYGAMSLLNLKNRINVPKMAVADSDILVLAAPVWTADVALPMRTWLQRHPALPQRVALVMTYGDAHYPDDALKGFQALTQGRKVLAQLALHQDQVDSEEAAQKIETFCAALKKGQSPLAL